MSAAPRSRFAAVRAFSGMSAQTSRRSPSQTFIFFVMPVFVMAFVGLALRGYTTPQMLVGMLGTPGSAAAQQLAEALDVVDGDALGNPPIGYQYSAPSNLVLFVVMNAILNTLLIVDLRRRGLGKRLVATPASRSELTLALAVGPLQLMTIQAAFLIAVGALAFGVKWGDPLAVFALTASLVLMGTGLYLLLGTIFRSGAQAGGLGPFLGILLGMLGGCMWPLEIVSDPVAIFGHLFPTAWAMDGYVALIFGRAGGAAVLPSVAVLLAMGALFASLGALRLRRHLRRG